MHATKNPQIKAETAGFIPRVFCRCPPVTLPKKSLKTYVAALLKIAGDSVPKVRKNVFSALGAAWKVVGEQNVMVFLADVDHLKMEKIKESMEKTILLDAKGNPRTGGGGGGAAPAATAKAGCWRRRGRGQRREGGERRRQRSRGQKRQESGRGRQRSPGLI